jgi:hypothetical protein
MSEIVAMVPTKHHLDRRADEIAAAGAGNADDLFTTAAVADWLGVSVQWLEIGRSSGRKGKPYGPCFVRLSPRRIRYRRSDVLAWLASRTHKATREYEGR